MEVRVDTRVEAISIFFTLATRDSVQAVPTPSTYYHDFNQYFEEYKNHPSVVWYRNLNHYDGWDISSIGLYMSNKAHFWLNIPYSAHYLHTADIATFLTKFNAFYKDCKVENFIKLHEGAYKKMAEFTKNSILESGILNVVQEFYQKQVPGKLVVLVEPLNNLGNNTISDEKLNNVRFIKLAYLTDKKATQHNEAEVKFAPLPNVIAHEVSHLYLKDFISMNKERLSKKKALFLTTAKNEVLKETEWENELDELMVRVCVTKILRIKYGLDREAQEITNQSRHFKYFKELSTFFDYYIQNQNKYKSIKAFYPEVISFIEALK